MTLQKLRPSFTFTQDRLTELQSVIPEAFADGRINWDVLKEALEAFLEEEGPDAEHFGLFWPGKRDARRLSALPSKGTLKPATGEGVNENTTGNIFIEGDNLEVLKLLQKSYASRIKMIYIDPPYNSGNDFVYKDDFREPLEDYLRKTGQIDEEGKMLTTNTKSDGRFHSNWLNMMYPRLRLARQLLRDDGVIFISIDDIEQANLRIMCEDIFGAENFVGQIVRVTKKTSFRGNYFAPSKDYILCFAKEIRNLSSFSDEVNEEQYNKIEIVGKRKGEKYRDDIAFYLSTLETRPNQRYFIECPDGQKVLPPGKTFPPDKPIHGDGVWRWNKTTYEEKKDLLAFKRTNNSPLIDKDGNQARWNIYTKSYLNDKIEKGNLPRDFIDNFPNRNGSETLRELGIPFDFPKPVELIKYLMKITKTQQEDVIMDFFAGSCTTAQSMLELNHEDESNRRFIMVQLPEPTGNKEFPTISEIGEERIRRVIMQMQQEVEGKLDLSTRNRPEDIGFKVFKLSHSNYKAWQDYNGENIQELETLFDRIENPLIEEWSKEDLLVEILLLQGFPLDSSVSQQKRFAQNTILLVDSSACTHRLFVCLDVNIADDTIEQLHLHSEDIFVCLDSALDDQSKVRLADTCNLNII